MKTLSTRLLSALIIILLALAGYRGWKSDWTFHPLAIQITSTGGSRPAPTSSSSGENKVISGEKNKISSDTILLKSIPDKIGSGDTIEFIGVQKTYHCMNPRSPCDNMTGNVFKFTSKELGISFLYVKNLWNQHEELHIVRNGDNITLMSIRPYNTEENHEGDIYVFKKTKGQSTNDAIKDSPLWKDISGCYIDNMNIFDDADFNEKNRKTEFEYLRIYFDDTKITKKLLEEHDCDPDEYDSFLCPILCFGNIGTPAPVKAFFIGKKDSSHFYLIVGGQDYWPGGNGNNWMETIEIIN